MNSHFLAGMRDGLPIGLGYFSVSLGFGILAVHSGLSVLAATLISLTNLTSAGQAAGVVIISYGGTLVEMALTQLVINLRYSLMGISLSQKVAPSFTTRHRLLAAFGITDENFAVASSRSFPITPQYMYGIMSLSVSGWVLGTLCGAAAGQLLPPDVVNAMGILLYGMFLAIFIPPARKERSVLLVVLTAAALSVTIYYLIPGISAGFSVIISGLAAAALGAWLFPVAEEERA